jgi:hypothetical protein
MADKIEDIAKKYGIKIEKSFMTEENKEDFSREYLKFKTEINPALSGYEKYCKSFGKLFNLKLNQKDYSRLSKSLNVAHIDVKPEESAGLSIFSFISILLLSILITIVLFLFANVGFDILLPFIFLLFLIAVFVYYYINSLPDRLAQSWRLKASAQMVPCILYIVVYMRHTSNLELAIKFASQHLQPPLALDLKKIFWDVETGKYSTIKEALDAYLESWRDYSLEFIESFHLIESSLYEPGEERRIEILEKSLTVILEGVYDKMLKYTHEVQGPLTNVYMLGIVLPTLAIAMLPLASALMGGSIQWWHIALLFNILIPFFVFYMTYDILSKRPGGYGESDLLELNPDYPFYKSKKHYYKALAIAVPLILLGLLPFIFQYTPISDLFGIQRDATFQQIGFSIMPDNCIFDFKTKDGVCAIAGNGVTGPFGLGALLLSLLIPFGASLFFIISYKSKTAKLIKTREETSSLETEFASSLFQLGNRLGDGIPAEMAFGRVAESLKGTPTENFFKTVNSNIQQMGMSVREAIFNPARGAIIYFPSSLVRTSMEILTESVKKGLQVAARALMSISQYVKNIQKINERLKDLLADIISSMKSNMSFLAPLLAGIVVGLASMITLIMNRLNQMILSGASKETNLGGMTTLGNLTDLFNLKNMIPPYYVQIITGVYLIEIIYILTITLVTVESGVDKLKEKSDIAGNLQKGMTLYIFACLASIIALSMLAAVAISGMAAG